MASWKAQLCSKVVDAPFFRYEQPFPDTGLGQVEPRLKAIQTGSLALDTASFTLAFKSLCTDAEGAVFVQRDDVAGAFSRHDGSERVLACTSVWDQNSGDSDALCEWILLTSVVSSIADLIGKS